MLIRRCRDNLPRYEERFAASVTDALDRAADGLDERDAVVHQLWPAPRPAGGLGWRHLPPLPHASSRPLRHIWVQVDLSWLRTLLDTLTVLVDDVDRLRQGVPDTRRSGPT